MSHARKVRTVALLAAVAWAVAPVAEGQRPIRIGATLAQTGELATIAEAFARGYRLCVKHANDKGGVVGRTIALVFHDDRSDPATAVRLYEQLITRDKVDLVLGPYGSPITDAAADVTEKHRMPMVAPAAGSTPIYRKGRKFLFSMRSPIELDLEGLLDLAAKKGLKTVALISRDDLFGRSTAQGATELVKKKDLRLVFTAAYAPRTTDFSATLTKVRAADPDVVAVATNVLDDAVAITRHTKALDVNPRMLGLSPMPLAKFPEVLGRDADFVYLAATWVPELVELRAGGLIPIARQYPGAREFVESSKKEFAGLGASADAYGACQIVIEAIRRVGSLDSAKLRDAISTMDHHTVYGRFRVNGEGIQTGQQMLLTQWQDGRRAIVWPEELAPDKPRFPTPPWSQRP